MITVAETRHFLTKVVRLLSETEKAELIAYLSVHPFADAFRKNEKDNLSMEEKKYLSRQVSELVKYWSQKQ